MRRPQCLSQFIPLSGIPGTIQNGTMSEPVSHERIRLGISACLLGQQVRFDGGHKRDPFLVESLGAFVEWVPVCPEVESGMGAPRESMRLVLVSGEVRLLTNKSVQD